MNTPYKTWMQGWGLTDEQKRQVREIVREELQTQTRSPANAHTHVIRSER